MSTIKIKSTHPESQGPFVVINSADFDEGEHELYVKGDANGDGKVTVAEIKAKLDEMGIEYQANAKKGDLLGLLDKEQS